MLNNTHSITDSKAPIGEQQQSDTAEVPLYLTDESVEAFLQFKLERGVSPATVRSYKNPFGNLQRWLGESPELTAERLRQWRQYLEDSGFSKNTVQSYVKRINDYLRNHGCSALCIPKPLRHELKGKTFGCLTVLELTDKRKRSDRLWRCKCSCGCIAEFMTSQLVSGHTRSCGRCSRSNSMKYRLRIAEDTSIVKALTDDAVSKNSASGYTGVYRKRDKWIAVIVYKKKRYSLGTYKKAEDAVRARARAKELIMADGERMEAEYAHLFAEKPMLPTHRPLPPKPLPEPVIIAKNRTDNTSGQRGVSRHRDKWYAKINYMGVRYHLGTYDFAEEAIAARLLAEECVKNGDIDKLKTMHTGVAM